ncbi:hypothetical protein DL768_004577 [Monosporascus sp. mg162]|nr:hypothetical protein DL768_004577 [Monosporascus sp. mg162]
MPIPRSEYLSSVWNDGIFNGRVVFVTGGAGTICSAQTRALVALGANACIIGRNQQKTEAAAIDIATAREGAKVIGIGGCDVRNPENLKSAAERCVKELGAIDFVIAGAAGNFVAPISGLSANAFKSVIDIDVLGTYNTVKATMPYLVESAARNPNPTAKASVDSIMASVALEYGPLGVTSNVISPGGIAGSEGMERLAGSGVDEKISGKSVPLGRWGTIRDIADATVYVFSDAGNYVNGEILVVDGGNWRTGGRVGLDSSHRYPDYLLKGEFSKHVKSGRKEKPNL